MTVQGNRGVALVVRAALRLGSGGMERIGNLQSGIAIAPILFVVAILAVLAVAISAASGAFNGDTSAVSAKAQATAILEYAEQVKMAVDRVLGHGCTDTQVSFENPFVGGYTNPNAPSDKSCHVFDVNGGGIVWKKVPSDSQDTAAYGVAALAFRGSLDNYVYSSVCVTGVGTGGRYPSGGSLDMFPCYFTGVNGVTSADLVMVMPWVTRDVCTEINRLTNFKHRNDGRPPTDYYFNLPGAKFVGAYYGAWGNGGVLTDTLYGNPSENFGTHQGCVDHTELLNKNPGGGYLFFKVLIAR